MFSLTLSKLFGWKHYGNPQRFKRFSINSKSVQKGDIFVPLKGSRRDGHEFIEDALKRGAVGFLFESGKIPAERLFKFLKRGFAIEVPNTFQALKKIAAYRRKSFGGREVIAITGTAGKTTTKELIAHLLSLAGRVYKTPGNLNSRVGVPLSLANAEGGDYWVFELGASERGNIRGNAELLKPTLSVLTSLGRAHLEGFKSFENLSVAKGEIFLPESVKVAVLPARFVNLYKTLLADKRVFTFGEGGEVKVERFRFTKEGKTELLLGGERLEVNLLGVGIVRAVEVAAAVLRALGLPHLELLAEGLGSFEGEWGRLKPLRGDGFLVIDDCYNANPLSMRAALETLAAVEGYTRRVAILGDMLELGKFEEEEHRRLGKLLNKLPVSEVYLLGNLTRYTCGEIKNKPCRHFFEMEELLRFLKKREPQRDSVYLIKGSRGLKMERILKVFFNY